MASKPKLSPREHAKWCAERVLEYWHERGFFDVDVKVHEKPVSATVNAWITISNLKNAVPPSAKGMLP